MPTIDIEDLKRHMNIIDEVDDVLLAQKIAASEDFVGNYVGGFDRFEGTVPASLKEAVRLLAAHLYECREAALIGVSAAEMPFGVRELIENYREWAC